MCLKQKNRNGFHELWAKRRRGGVKRGKRLEKRDWKRGGGTELETMN